MTILQCPNCGKDIELIGQKELAEEYNLRPNPVANLRARGEFPEPVLSFGNRNMWLRSDIEEYEERRRIERIQRIASDLEETISKLPESEQASARKLIADGGKKR